jgi:hypothetical protein
MAEIGIGIARAMPRDDTGGTMSDEGKVIVTGITTTEEDPWDPGIITERLPILELGEDAIEPADQDSERDRAA